MKKLIALLFILSSMVSLAQVNVYTVRGKYRVETDSIVVINGDTIYLNNAQEGQIIQYNGGKFVNQDAVIDTASHAVTSDTATVALITQTQTNILRVDQTPGKGEYTTIQAAIDYANTQTGIWQIQVNEGTYNEQLTLYDSINVVGVEDDMVTITSACPVITFASEKSAIKDLTITGTTTSAVIYANNTSSTSEIKVQNCDINTVCCMLDFTTDGIVFFQNNNLISLNTSTGALTNSIFKIRGSTRFIANTNTFTIYDNRASGNMIMFDDSTYNRTLYGGMFVDVFMTNASYTDNVTAFSLLGGSSTDIQNTIQNYSVNNGTLHYVTTTGGGEAHLDITASDLNFDSYASMVGITHSTGDTINLNLPSVNADFEYSGTGILNVLINKDGTLETTEDIVDKNMFIGTSTNQSLQDFFNITASAGWDSGGEITILTDSTVTVAAGTGMIRTSNSSQAPLKMFDWPDTVGMYFPDMTSYYIYVDYNAGSPVVKSTTNGASVRQNENDKFELYEIVRNSDTIHVSEHFQKAGDLGSLMQKWIYARDKIIRSETTGGLILSETGTRNISMSAGLLMLKLNFFDIDAINTSASDTFDRYYRDGSGGWTKQSAQTQWSNNQYDNGTGTLATMGASKYSFQEFYVETDGQLVSLFGQAEYTSQALAETAPRISSVPTRVEEHSIYIGRIVFQTNSSSAASELSAFVDEIGGAGSISNHNDLAGLNTAPYLHVNTDEKQLLLAFEDSVASASAVELNTAHRVADGDLSSTNELNTTVDWNDGTNTLSVTDAGGTKSDVITGFLESSDLNSINAELSDHSDSLANHETRLVAIEDTTYVYKFNGRSGNVTPLSGDYTTTLVTEGTNLYYTTERAQDAVGGILVNSADIQFFYDDGTPSISASVLEAGVDHDQLLNYVAGEHLDTTTLATLWDLDTTYNALSADISSISGNYVFSTNPFGTDNRMLKSDGTGRGVQVTGISIDDSDNMTGVGKLSVNDSIIGKTGRSTTLFVAASDATNLEKSQADYICTGTNDQDTINAALDIGGHIKLSTGTFYISASGRLSGNAVDLSVEGTWLQGSGKEKTFLVLQNNIDENVVGSVDTDHVKVSDLSVDGNLANNSPTAPQADAIQNGVYFKNVDYGIVENVRSIKNVFHGIFLTQSNYCDVLHNELDSNAFRAIHAHDFVSYNKFIGNYCHANGQGNGVTTPILGGMFVIYDNSFHNVVTNNIIKDDKVYGMQIGGPSADNVVSNNVIDCQATSLVHGIYINDGVVEELNLSGNLVNVTGHGILMQSYQHNNITINNNVILSAQKGIYVNNERVFAVNISSNIIESSSEEGIYFTSPVNNNYDISITSNRVKTTATDDGIYLNKLYNSVISSNIVNSSEYGIYINEGDYINMDNNVFTGIAVDEIFEVSGQNTNGQRTANIRDDYYLFSNVGNNFLGDRLDVEDTIQANVISAENLTANNIAAHSSDESGFSNTGLWWNFSNGNFGVNTALPKAKIDFHDSQIYLTGNDISQPITGVWDASMGARIQLRSSTTGGVLIDGHSDTDAEAVLIRGVVGSSTITVPAIEFLANKFNTISGTQALANSEIAYRFRNEGTTLLEILGSGAATFSSTVSAPQLISTATTGTAPLDVSSTTKVDLLNSDQVDGFDLDQSVSTTATPTFADIRLDDPTAAIGYVWTATDIDGNGQWEALPAGHDPVTLAASATAGGLSLSTQEIGFRAATNAQTGYATAAHIQAIEANTAESHSHSDKEIPTGLINGSNDTFTLANTPITNSELVSLNGVIQESGASFDYTISGNTITFNAGNIPQTNDRILVWYRY